MPRRPSASGNVLLLLCAMYFITYVDRVNVSTAAGAFRAELGLSNLELGLVFSAFAYPYLFFQVAGGWIGDRFGARWTLTACGLVWACATILTGFSTGLVSMLAARALLGLGEGATFPVATRAMSSWLPPERAGFAQGITHSSARLGNAITPPLVVGLIALLSWRASFIIVGACSLLWAVLWGLYFRDDPRTHAGITPAEAARAPRRAAPGPRAPVPWGPLLARMAPVIFVYFCYGWTLWAYLSWMPQFMLHAYHLNLKNSAFFASLVFVCGVVGDALGGILSDRILARTGNLLYARRNLVMLGMAGSLLCSLPILFVRDPLPAALALGGAFFFAELTIGPMWAIPMDIAPAFSGTASGLMNTGSALAAILSPLAFGWIIDATGNWTLPFVGTIVLMLCGVGASLLMRPDRRFEAAAVPVHA